MLACFYGFFLSIPIFPSLKSPTLHTRQAAYLRPSVRPPIDNFRRGVEWAPTERLQELVLLVQVGKPKVRNLQREVRPREPVSTAVSVCASSAHTSQTRASEVPLAGPASWVESSFALQPWAFTEGPVCTTGPVTPNCSAWHPLHGLLLKNHSVKGLSSHVSKDVPWEIPTESLAWCFWWTLKCIVATLRTVCSLPKISRHPSMWYMHLPVHQTSPTHWSELCCAHLGTLDEMDPEHGLCVTILQPTLHHQPPVCHAAGSLSHSEPQFTYKKMQTHDPYRVLDCRTIVRMIRKKLIKVRLWRPRCFVTFKSLGSSQMFFLTLLLLYHTPLGITLFSFCFLKCFISLHGNALPCVCVCTYSYIHIRHICYMYTHTVTCICILCIMNYHIYSYILHMYV